MQEFELQLAETAGRIEPALAALLGRSGSGECEAGRLQEAMCHAVLGGGKRLRPFVVIAAADLFGVPEEAAMRTACALELLHCYSLVHDDLPAMDDDDLRRGQPTVHRAFDEATAILAGDSLLTLAFEIVADPRTHGDGEVRAGLALELARAGGRTGMAGGQMRDLAAEGRFTASGRPLRLSEQDVTALQDMKTGALFQFAAVAGPILARAGSEDRDRMARYGAALGRAFQIADDLLDEEADASELGKAAGKDRAAGKATLPAVIGIEAARDRLAGAVAEAHAALEVYGERAALLGAAARFAAARRK
ncbi:polyprenyl synthetase family protein [Microbaculum marinum]|uniref:Probable farnesyl diphosphate synthase n=1 Tax=Microbaculum marinum TaxID=1764581 RepID=A0AAW9R9Q0_9HYPH